jgi:CDP-glucose 4,6-dehydratase
MSRLMMHSHALPTTGSPSSARSLRDTFRGRRVLLTGHTGFKGSWLAIWLHDMGAEVYGFALPPKTPRDNFVVAGVERIARHHIGDVRDREALVEYTREVQPEFAFHLAAQTLVLASYQDPHETFETNVMGTVNFLEAVRSTPSVRVAVNVTSDKCYENHEWAWGYRESDAMGGKDPYSASKGCAELVTSSYRRCFARDGLRLATARAGNVIGGGDWAADRIVPDYFRARLAGESLTLRHPESVRPWQHVLEPLGGYLHLAARLDAEGGRFEGGWNFGPSDWTGFSVRDLIVEIGRSDPKAVPLHLAQQEAAPPEAGYLRLDISLAVNRLGWHPVLSFREAVRMTVEGYLAELDGGDVLAHRLAQIRAYEDLGLRV